MGVPTSKIRTNLLIAMGRLEEALKALERDPALQPDHLQVAASWAKDAEAAIGMARALLDPAARMERLTAARGEVDPGEPHHDGDATGGIR